MITERRSDIVFPMLRHLGKQIRLPQGNQMTAVCKRTLVPKRWSSSMQSPFRIGEHIGNLENKGTPYVLIETSFLSNCTIGSEASYLVSKPAAGLKALKFVENAVRKNGATPISLGMIDGEVFLLGIECYSRLSLG